MSFGLKRWYCPGCGLVESFFGPVGDGRGRLLCYRSLGKKKSGGTKRCNKVAVMEGDPGWQQLKEDQFRKKKGGRWNGYDLKDLEEKGQFREKPRYPPTPREFVATCLFEKGMTFDPHAFQFKDNFLGRENEGYRWGIDVTQNGEPFRVVSNHRMRDICLTKGIELHYCKGGHIVEVTPKEDNEP